jgi:hypothetical protein
MSTQPTPEAASPDGHFEKRVELVEKDNADVGPVAVNLVGFGP